MFDAAYLGGENPKIVRQRGNSKGVSLSRLRVDFQRLFPDNFKKGERLGKEQAHPMQYWHDRQPKTVLTLF